jgi:hypothetical protein
MISFIMSVHLSVCMKQFSSHYMDLDEILYVRLFENLPRKFMFYQNPTKITGTLCEDVFTSTSISH